MIFVTVGTSRYPFPRLINQAIELARSTKQKIVIQSGTYAIQKLLPANVVIKPFFSFSETQQLLKTAKLIISHAGVGTILQALHYGKEPLVMPRLKKYGEHASDHQVEVAHYLAQKKVRAKDKEQLIKKLDDYTQKLDSPKINQ